jgi:hypothetical protein
MRPEILCLMSSRVDSCFCLSACTISSICAEQILLRSLVTPSIVLFGLGKNLSNKELIYLGGEASRSCLIGLSTLQDNIEDYEDY